MITLEKITKLYGAHYAIKDIDCDFNNNEAVAILGPSGSGKSTLLRCISGLEIPTSGKTYIHRQKVTSKNRRKLSLKIGMVFQSFNLFPHMNVESNLIYGPMKVLGLSAHDAYKKAVKLLDQFGLSTKILARPNNLSGGQKQRVAICRALMMNPEVMLFDEPTSALDPESTKDVIEAISLLKKQMITITVTHNIRFASIIADRIIFMDHGLILASQKTRDFFTEPQSQRATLFLENLGEKSIK